MHFYLLHQVSEQEIYSFPSVLSIANLTENQLHEFTTYVSTIYMLLRTAKLLLNIIEKYILKPYYLQHSICIYYFRSLNVCFKLFSEGFL